MYRDKEFRTRALGDVLADLDGYAGDTLVEKVFVADGDALVMPLDHWMPILERCRRLFPRLRRVSCYAMARNILGKTDVELAQLRESGLSMLYIGPESGDDVTLKRIAKGDDAAAHVEAARRARAAGMALSVIALLGIAMDRSQEHARATADLVTAMDPGFFSALTVTVVPGTPLATLQSRGRFDVPFHRGAFAGASHDGRPRPADRRRLPHQPRLELPTSRWAPPRRPRAHRAGDRRRAGGEDPAPQRGDAGPLTLPLAADFFRRGA